jgi:cytosine/uracil/thiamine/allantoin permease
MKKKILKTSAVVVALIGLLLLPTLLYNLCGIAGMQDCADVPKWISSLIIVGIIGLFVLSYWLFQRGRLLE